MPPCMLWHFHHVQHECLMIPGQVEDLKISKLNLKLNPRSLCSVTTSSLGNYLSYETIYMSLYLQEVVLSIHRAVFQKGWEESRGNPLCIHHCGWNFVGELTAWIWIGVHPTSSHQEQVHGMGHGHINPSRAC